MQVRNLAVPSAVRPEIFGIAAATIVFCGGILAWASLAQLDAGALAQGDVIPAGRVKTVQHLEGGIIARLLVKDGDAVRQGQDLLLLDESQASAEFEIVRTERSALEALAARLTAERDARPLGVPRATGAESIDNQVRLFEARRAALARERSAYSARVGQARTEFAAWRARETSLARTLALAGEETQMNRTLVAQNFVARPRVLQLESREAEVGASLQEAAAEKSRAAQKIIDAELALAKLQADWMTTVLEELRKAHEGLAQAKEKESIARRRVERTRVPAPQDGRVQGLRFVTVGGVVPPGGAILDIVPQSDQLVVEARISPDDIDVVRPGLASRVRFSAYRSRTQIALDAVVTEVSADVVRDEKRNLSYYTARVEITDADALTRNRMLLTPGMQAQVEIITGRRTVMRYLLDPLLNAARRGFWED